MAGWGAQHYKVRAPFHAQPVVEFPLLRMELFTGVSDFDEAAAALMLADAEEVDTDGSYASSDDGDESGGSSSRGTGRRRAATKQSIVKSKNNHLQTKSFTEALDDHSKAARAAARAVVRGPLASYQWFSIFGTGSKRCLLYTSDAADE